MAKEEFKSILERKTEEIRAFREELRKKSLEGIDSQFEVLQKRINNLGNSLPEIQKNEPAEEMQKGNNLDVKTEKLKISKIPEKPRAVKIVKRKIKTKIKKQRKAIKKIDKVKEKKTAHTSRFGSEEAEIKRRLQEVLKEEKGLSINYLNLS